MTSHVMKASIVSESFYTYKNAEKILGRIAFEVNLSHH